METEKVELIDFNQDGYLADGDFVYSKRPEIEALADKLSTEGYKNIYLMGIGGTEFELYQFAYAANRMSALPVKCINAADLNSVHPRDLTQDSIVITASDSGNTPEIIEAAKWLIKANIRLIAFTKKSGELGGLAPNVIEVNGSTGSGQNYYMAEAMLIYCLLYKHGDFAGYPKFADQLKGVFKDLLAIRKKFEPKADKIAQKCYQAPYTIFTGSGALWGETELFAECLLEEMQWIRTRPITSAKFFHGTLELVEKGVPVFIVEGEDEFRKQDVRVQRFCEKIGAEHYVIDTKEYSLSVDDEFRPLVIPWIVNSLLTDRLTNHYQVYTKHNKNYRRYYRQFEY
ncbi:SIS domain-containing protein [Lactobacillus sp. B4026]|uniref:SIS domain-containing protein n=1 Tax=Lactobacillus sp. B4026 TaxID=2818035 RepID=UPI00226B5DFB|nr:SIS domain-containing protein [Lactobacillus sp. B4026]MCX8736784.1 SIS domain-containing protein [Lactobacillus sp. B4026]